MKKTLKEILVTLCIPIAYSPIQAQDWTLLGNTPTTTQFLGTTNLTDIRFNTNNSQKMVLTAAGNLGIGIGTPAARLHLTRNSNNSAPGSLFRKDGLSTEVN